MRSPRPVRLPARTAGVLSVGLATGAVATVTLLNRFGTLPLRDVASSQRAVDEGRVWLLLTSAFVADRLQERLDEQKTGDAEPRD